MLKTTMRIIEVRPCWDVEGAFHVRYKWGAEASIFRCVPDVDNAYHAVNRTINQVCESKGLTRDEVMIVKDDDYDAAVRVQPETAQDTSMEEQVLREKFLNTIENLIRQAREEERMLAESVRLQDRIKHAEDLQSLRESLRIAGERTIQRVKEDLWNEQARFEVRILFGYPSYQFVTGDEVYRNVLVAMSKAIDLMRALKDASMNVESILVRDMHTHEEMVEVYPDGSMQVFCKEPTAMPYVEEDEVPF